MQLKKLCRDFQRQPICIDDAYHDYIIDEIERRDNIGYERKIHNDDK